MRTPPKPSRKDARRNYTAEEKRQLLANLDIEVAHRTRQFETSLADILENFRNHHEGQVLRVPKLVRGLTMGEFADKYNGDINEAMKGLHKDRAGGEPVPIDASARKRKWDESKPDPPEAESSRAGKLARLQASPAKAGPSNLRISRVVKTPGASRSNRYNYSQANSPSPSKFVPTRPISPSKLPPGSRPPTAMTFNPYLPKTPGLPRPPRRNESMMSINGSPLEIPHQNGYLGGSIEEEDEEDGEGDSRHGKRTTIIVRRDPSFSFTSQNGRHPPSRTNSQTNGFMPSSQKSNSSAHSSSQPSSSQSTQPASSQSQNFRSHTRSKSQLSAVVRVPTRDGHLLEFDPLLTSPEEIDGLEGITDTAKKQAKDDIARLVQTALAKWTI
ncbi:hypothetical protein BD410DRAFT_723257 [Rickenella mellea]|uniref:Uncharacterized protein n=1 Tax=Rickenella mellea TaxID=50990 RepID=A0A4Y7Q610_9AGAM|nr:hypothetical protein BD410DRAFT_723257 [Rickenella mellea]